MPTAYMSVIVDYRILLYLQVNVETVLEQVLQGSVSASSIIRGQHDLLSMNMDREQKTKRKLVSCEECGLDACWWLVSVLLPVSVARQALVHLLPLRCCLYRTTLLSGTIRYHAVYGLLPTV